MSHRNVCKVVKILLLHILNELKDPDKEKDINTELFFRVYGIAILDEVHFTDGSQVHRSGYFAKIPEYEMLKIPMFSMKSHHTH